MRLLSYPTTSPEPVTAVEARLRCRIVDTALDGEIDIAISAAREQAEQITGRWYRAQTRRAEFTEWPETSVIELPCWQPETVVISYRSAAAPADWTTLSASAYKAAPLDRLTRIQLVPGQNWPELAGEEWGPRVRIDVSVLAASPMPTSVRTFVLACVAAWIDEPGALLDGRLQANPLHERLLDGERLWC